MPMSEAETGGGTSLSVEQPIAEDGAAAGAAQGPPQLQP